LHKFVPAGTEPNPHTEQIDASCRGPSTPQTAMAVGYAGGRPASGVGNFKGHRDGQMSNATIVKRNWSSCYLRVVDGIVALCCWLAIYSGSFRWQMTVVEIIIAELHCLSNGWHCCWPVCSCNLNQGVTLSLRSRLDLASKW